MLTPMVPLPAAAPSLFATVAAPPAAFTSPEYVYLLRVVEDAHATNPSAKMPTVLLPAAEPVNPAAVEAVADATTQPE
jgi:hypothetical protein